MPFKYNPHTKQQDYYENGGPMGPAGPAGRDGRDGVGRDGVDGIDGAPGEKGDPGEGVPPGGTENQILAKLSNNDYETVWIDAPTGGGGGGLTILAATGNIDDNNLAFTFISEPIFVVVNGATYRNGHGCTIVGANAFLDDPAGINGDVYGIGTSLSVLEATGDIDGINLLFTFVSTPSLVVVNGASYRHGHGCAIAGTNIILDNPVGEGGDIYGL